MMPSPMTPSAGFIGCAEPKTDAVGRLLAGKGACDAQSFFIGCGASLVVHLTGSHTARSWSAGSTSIRVRADLASARPPATWGDLSPATSRCSGTANGQIGSGGFRSDGRENPG